MKNEYDENIIHSQTSNVIVNKKDLDGLLISSQEEKRIRLFEKLTSTLKDIDVNSFIRYDKFPDSRIIGVKEGRSSILVKTRFKLECRTVNILEVLIESSTTGLQWEAVTIYDDYHFQKITTLQEGI